MDQSKSFIFNRIDKHRKCIQNDCTLLTTTFCRQYARNTPRMKLQSYQRYSIASRVSTQQTSTQTSYNTNDYLHTTRQLDMHLAKQKDM